MAMISETVLQDTLAEKIRRVNISTLENYLSVSCYSSKAHITTFPERLAFGTLLLVLIYSPAQHKRTGFIHYLNTAMENRRAGIVYTSILVDGQSFLWREALVWSEVDKCPATDQNKAPVEEHLSAVARGTLHHSCGASLSERWHRLHWLPEAHRKQIVVLFSPSTGKGSGSKTCPCLLMQKNPNVFLLSLRWWVTWVNHSLHIKLQLDQPWSSPLWSNSNNVPIFLFYLE